MEAGASLGRGSRAPAGIGPGPRPDPSPVPRGGARLSWYGPALLWMVSAVGSGSVLFTPRVAARYEYALLWVALLTCGFMWVMIREAARYTTLTGKTLLDGFNRLPGPRGWALWVIFLPQLFAAVVGVAGLCALVGSAAQVAGGGSHAFYTLAMIGLSTALVAWGEYGAVERLCRYMAILLILLSGAAAAQVFPGPAVLAAGLTPSLPEAFDLKFVLPWIGTILAGSMGIVWFSYWTATEGYGGASALSAETRRPPDAAPCRESAERWQRLRGWNLLVSRAAGVAVLCGTFVILSFNVLGAELLAPQGTIPAGMDVARDLAALLGEIWGSLGFWTLIALTLFALGGSVIANQDGWSRSFADMTLLLLGREPRWLPRRRLKRLFVLVVTGALPAGVYLLVRDPVEIMSLSGVVAAAHTPFIVLLILIVNRRHLPKGLAPGVFSTLLLAAAGLYYLGVSALRMLV